MKYVLSGCGSCLRSEEEEESLLIWEEVKLAEAGKKKLACLLFLNSWRCALLPSVSAYARWFCRAIWCDGGRCQYWI